MTIFYQKNDNKFSLLIINLMELYLRAPVICIPKHFLPRTRLIVDPFPGHIRPLEGLNTSFRMRHHGQMSSVCRTNTSQTFYATVGVHRVNFGGLAIIIYVSKRYQILFNQIFVYIIIFEREATLAVGNPNTKRRSCKIILELLEV